MSPRGRPRKYQTDEVRQAYRLKPATLHSLDAIAAVERSTQVDALRLAAEHVEAVAYLAPRISAIVGLRCTARACAEWVLHAATKELERLEAPRAFESSLRKHIEAANAGAGNAAKKEE